MTIRPARPFQMKVMISPDSLPSPARAVATDIKSEEIPSLTVGTFLIATSSPGECIPVNRSPFMSPSIQLTGPAYYSTTSSAKTAFRSLPKLSTTESGPPASAIHGKRLPVISLQILLMAIMGNPTLLSPFRELSLEEISVSTISASML